MDAQREEDLHLEPQEVWKEFLEDCGKPLKTHSGAMPKLLLELQGETKFDAVRERV